MASYNIDISGIDISGIDISGIDISGIDISGIILLGQDINFFNIGLISRYKLDIKYFLEYKAEINEYIKTLKINILKNNNVTDISAIVIELPKKNQKNIAFENNYYDISFTDTSTISINTYDSRYLNNVELIPGTWNIAILKNYIDVSTNIIEDAEDKMQVIIPHRDFLYNNNQIKLDREEDNKNILFFRIEHHELLNYRNNIRRYLYLLGKSNKDDETSYLKSFFEFITWLPDYEATLSSTNNWFLPDDYKGPIDERILSCPTYYTDNSNNILLYKNLSNFNEPGFRYDNKTKNTNLFYLNRVAKLQELNGNVILQEFNTISKQYYLIQNYDSYKNFNNLKFKSLVTSKTDITDWEAEIFIPEDVRISNNIIDEETQELGDCSGVYSYAFKNNAQNIEFGLGLIGTGNLITGTNETITNSNKLKSYIYKDKNGDVYHADLSKYRVIYDFENKVFNGGFKIKYVFRKNKILETDPDGNQYYTDYVDTYIFINDIYHTKIERTGEKLNNINYWGVYNNINSNLIRCPTKVFESIENSTYIDDIYSNDNTVYWDKYIPSLVQDKNLSVFGTNGNSITLSNETFPFYLIHNGETTTGTSVQEYNLIIDAGENNNIYLTIEDFLFNYSIVDMNKDKLNIELSNDGTNWLVPGVDIDGIEWFYKQMTRNSMQFLEFPSTYINELSKEYSGTYPIQLKSGPHQDGPPGSNPLPTPPYNPNNNTTYYFDTHDNNLKYILIKKLKLALHQLNKYGIDKLSIEFSNDNINWEKPSYDWLLNETVEIIDPSNSIILNSSTTMDMFSLDVAYGTNPGENYPVQFLDSGGTTDNYQVNERYEYYFDAGENETISMLIKELRLENNNDILRIFGANDYFIDGSGNTRYNWQTMFVSFMKTSPNYNADSSVYGNGNYFPYSKQILNINLGNAVTDNIIFNTGFRYIKFEFISNQLDNYAGWDFTIYKTNQFINMGGNIFPSTIPNERVLETNYRYIKFNFISDNLFEDEGFEIEIYKKDIYDDKKYGNSLPTTINSAKNNTNIMNFNEINKIKFDYRYIKFKYLRIVSDLYNDNNKWRIRVDNKNKIYNLKELDITKTENHIFSENSYNNNYPVFFKLSDNNLDYPIQTNYSYTFDAGENNNINLEFLDFDLSHNELIDGEERNLEKDGKYQIYNRITISYSNDNKNWEPANISWAHKTNTYRGNINGSNLVARYYEFYTVDGLLKNTANIISWYDDNNGFLLPSNIEKAKEIYCYNNNISDISWNKINKIYTGYRYVKFILYFEDTTYKYNDVKLNVNIHINNNEGDNFGIIPNFNSLNIKEMDNCIDSLSFDLNATDVSLNSFLSNVRFIKNGKQIPYIARYDYRLYDISNNILLRSNIDTDTYFNIFSVDSNYNNNRTSNVLSLLKNQLKDNTEIINFNEKYNYTSKFFEDRNLNQTPYIPEKGDYKFIISNNTLNLNISKEILFKIKESIITFWRGNEYPTRFDLVLYIWYPWSTKYQEYTNNKESVSQDLRYLIKEETCDETIRITIEEGIYYEKNIVGSPSQNVFNYKINQFSGRYIFVWSYQIYQKNGLYDTYTPAQYFYNFDNNNMYVPNIEILNITDYVSDEFIYDPMKPIMTFIKGISNEDIDGNETNIEYNKINFKLNNMDINNFNNFIEKHKKSLETQNSSIVSISIKIFIWTPNNEKETNSDGWKLPDDYFGVDDKRITQTPYFFENNNRNLISNIWDPYYDNDSGERNFGFNVDASGTIVKEFLYYKDYFNENDIVFDISFDSIFLTENDENTTNYINNTDIPNPYLYKKNGIYGVPYISRWEYTIKEDKTFINSTNVSVNNINMNSSYDVGNSLITYSGNYPINFYDEGGANGIYGLSIDRQIVFDAGENKLICLQINNFNFNQTITGTTVNMLDRLSLFVSDDNISFTPVQIDWMYRSSNYGNDNNGDENGPDYLNNLAGCIFPANKTMALKTKYSTTNILPDASFNSLSLINLGKRYVKFRFVSSSSSIVNNDGWDIKIFNCNLDNITYLSSKVIYQEGGLGNTSVDFNYKFSINSDIYLELDKTIKQENPGILDFKDFKNSGVFLGFTRNKSFYIIKVNNILWQFVIKKPPEGYKFDLLDEFGNKTGETKAVLNNYIYTEDFQDLTFNENVNDNTNISGTNMSFEETLESTSFDGGRKYILYIRRSTEKEKEYFESFNRGRITQIETNQITNRASDWYPIETNFQLSNNLLHYATLFNTTVVELEEVDEDTDTSKIEIDPCGLCRTITKTKEENNRNIRYSNAVKINFRMASRVRTNICD